MKLLFPVVVSSMACGFFAGLFVSGPWSVALARIVVCMIGYWWIRAELKQRRKSRRRTLHELALFAGAGRHTRRTPARMYTVCAVERDAYAAEVLAQRQNDGILAPVSHLVGHHDV